MASAGEFSFWQCNGGANNRPGSILTECHFSTFGDIPLDLCKCHWQEFDPGNVMSHAAHNTLVWFCCFVWKTKAKFLFFFRCCCSDVIMLSAAPRLLLLSCVLFPWILPWSLSHPFLKIPASLLHNQILFLKYHSALWSFQCLHFRYNSPIPSPPNKTTTTHPLQAKLKLMVN